MNVAYRLSHVLLFFLLAVGFVCQAWADGPTDDRAYEKSIEKEYKMYKFRDCPYTDEMGAHTFQCIKDNDGFNAHGCYDDSVQIFCPQSDGGTYEKSIEKEYKMYKFRDCPYTDEMGAHTFQCIKDNDGFNAHGCYDDSVQIFCPLPGD
jgi:hypothetical protein